MYVLTQRVTRVSIKYVFTLNTRTHKVGTHCGQSRLTRNVAAVTVTFTRDPLTILAVESKHRNEK